jgi:peptidoglycan/LPS O-acetylase OafA/YrhL
LFAGWVFTYHVDLHAHFSAYLGAGAGLIRRGYLGVDGFFLLSGMILALVYPELVPAEAWRFWGKRLARVYPVHLAVLLLLGAVAVIGFSLGVTPRDPGRFTGTAFVENLLLIQGWGVAGQLAWNYPSWSVSTEWAGYLLFPAMWFWFGRIGDRWAAFLLAACLAVLALVDFRAHGLNLTFDDALWRFFPEFAAGMATARLLPVLASRVPGVALAGVGLGVILLSLLLAEDWCVVAGLWMVLTGFAVQAACGRAGIFRGGSVLRFLGVLSYAFYMSFGTIELFLAQLYRHLGWDPASDKLVYAASMTGLSFLLALSLHHLVENPARLLIDRRLAKPMPLAEQDLRL